MIWHEGCEVDTSKPPLGPPMRRVKTSIFGDYWDIKGNNRRTKLYQQYLKEYSKRLEN